jgi:hypothetical protein
MFLQAVSGIATEAVKIPLNIGQSIEFWMVEHLLLNLGKNSKEMVYS